LENQEKLSRLTKWLINLAILYKEFFELADIFILTDTIGLNTGETPASGLSLKMNKEFNQAVLMICFTDLPCRSYNITNRTQSMKALSRRFQNTSLIRCIDSKTSDFRRIAADISEQTSPYLSLKLPLDLP
jgi:hypothetical protein